MDRDDKRKVAKAIDTTVGVALAMEMTPDERKAMMEMGFDYTKHTRRMPSLSEACIMYLAQGDPPKKTEPECEP